MRFNKDQVLFAVQFTNQSDIDNNRIGTFSLPLRFHNEMPVKINFIKLTVAEHHKVYSEWEDRSKGTPQCDGFILKDDQGLRYSNQYPTASYGQISDTADRRFWRMADKSGNEDEGKFIAFFKENPNVPCEYNLLTDTLEDMQRGVKVLSEVKEDHPNYGEIQEKIKLLNQLIDRVKEEFVEAYPEYQIHLDFESLFAGSKVKHACCRIYRRITAEKAYQMSFADVMKELNDNDAFEVMFPSGDILCMEEGSGTYPLFGEETSVRHIKVYYGEKTEMYGEPGFMVCQTEYFNPKNKELAVQCFMQRLTSGAGYRHTRMGSSLECIASEQSIEAALRWKTEYFAKSLEPGKDFKVKLLNGETFGLRALQEGGYALEYSKPAGIIEDNKMHSVTATTFPEGSAEVAVNCYKAFVKMISETGFDPAAVNQEILMTVLERVAASSVEEAK